MYVYTTSLVLEIKLAMTLLLQQGSLLANSSLVLSYCRILQCPKGKISCKERNVVSTGDQLTLPLRMSAATERARQSTLFFEEIISLLLLNAKSDKSHKQNQVLRAPSLRVTAEDL